jgi:hypothetical protein
MNIAQEAILVYKVFTGLGESSAQWLQVLIVLSEDLG